MNISISAARTSQRKPHEPVRHRVDLAFDFLVACALKGFRCPKSHGPEADARLPSNIMRALVDQGRIRIFIHRWNWRVVTILTGPHRGKTTAPCPHKSKAYRVIDNGSERVRHPRIAP